MSKFILQHQDPIKDKDLIKIFEDVYCNFGKHFDNIHESENGKKMAFLCNIHSATTETLKNAGQAAMGGEYEMSNNSFRRTFEFLSILYHVKKKITSDDEINKINIRIAIKREKRLGNPLPEELVKHEHYYNKSFRKMGILSDGNKGMDNAKKSLLSFIKKNTEVDLNKLKISSGIVDQTSHGELVFNRYWLKSFNIKYPTPDDMIYHSFELYGIFSQIFEAIMRIEFGFDTSELLNSIERFINCEYNINSTFLPPSGKI